ncbi:MAG TPA: DUF2232 domain-containing protein [Methylovirgula sp.]|jgi:hypothetical protein|nr:DUF2232 domain-containing protein [Methylovirgula sp.]
MTKQTAQTFDIRFPVAFGSGLATALLFLAARQQSAFAALILASLAPLPIMIATLGFGHLTGLGAAFAAPITIAAFVAAANAAAFSTKVLVAAALNGLIFAVALSLPVWGLAWLATTGRSQVFLPWLRGLVHAAEPESEPVERPVAQARYPFGDILLSIAAIAVFIVSIVLVIWVVRNGGYAKALASAAAHVEPMIVEMIGARDLPKTLDLMTLAKIVIKIMPAVGACLITFALAANLWLAGRVVELSHRLPYPWPDIPHDLRVPRLLALVFAACCGLAFIDNLAGGIARTAAASLGILFVLQGLAVVHDLTRGMRFRTSLLCGLYLAIGFLMPWPFVIFAVIGLIDAGLRLRDKKPAAPPKS